MQKLARADWGGPQEARAGWLVPLAGCRLFWNTGPSRAWPNTTLGPALCSGSDVDYAGPRTWGPRGVGGDAVGWAVGAGVLLRLLPLRRMAKSLRGASRAPPLSEPQRARINGRRERPRGLLFVRLSRACLHRRLRAPIDQACGKIPPPGLPLWPRCQAAPGVTAPRGALPPAVGTGLRDGAGSPRGQACQI